MDRLARSDPKVAGAVVEFVYGPLVENPRRVGKPLRGHLAGLHSTRRGDYRILYRVEETAALVVVEAVGHRGDVYRP